MPRTYNIGDATSGLGWPEYTELYQLSPTTNLNTQVTTTVAGANATGRTRRGMLYLRADQTPTWRTIIGRNRVVYRASATLKTSSTSAVAGSILQVYAIQRTNNFFSTQGSFRGPTWNQWDSVGNQLWLTAGGEFKTASRFSTYTFTTTAALTTHNIDVTKPCQTASGRGSLQVWPLMLLFKLSVETDSATSGQMTFHSDNATTTTNRPTIKLTVGHVPMRTRRASVLRNQRGRL